MFVSLLQYPEYHSPSVTLNHVFQLPLMENKTYLQNCYKRFGCADKKKQQQEEHFEVMLNQH